MSRLGAWVVGIVVVLLLAKGCASLQNPWSSDRFRAKPQAVQIPGCADHMELCR